MWRKRMQPRELVEYLKAIGGFFLLPYVAYREIKDQVTLWNRKGFSTAGKQGEDGS
jgi:hypothetical protein